MSIEEMPKSRRVVRKSRKTRGRRLRGGFFGKLFEGFELPKMQMMGDEGSGGSGASGQMQAVSNIPVNIAGQIGKVDYAYDADKPAQVGQMQSTSTMPTTNQTMYNANEGNAPTAAVSTKPNMSVDTDTSSSGKTTTTVQTPQTIQSAVAVRPNAPVIPVRPTVAAPPPPKMGATSRTLLPVRRGGARKSRSGARKSRKGGKSRKSRKGRKGSRRH